jgi:hypothetical protein
MTLYKNAKGGADWWEIPLRFKWGMNTTSAEAAFKAVYQEADIQWSKCLHLRKGGMDKAGTAGVSEEAVSTMSKHSTSKIKQYVPQLHSGVMTVMAGFQTNEEYYVPRCFLDMPWTPDEMVRAIFPQYESWRQQYLSPQGDDSEAARNFIQETLPFLSMVALQDGIYWIKMYPNNSASTILKNTFPNYEAWASQARSAVIQQQAYLEQSRISTMEAATQASYHSLMRRIDSLQDEIREERNEQRVRTELLKQELEETRKERNELRLLLLQQANSTTVNQQQRMQSVLTTAGASVGTVPIAPRVAPTHQHTIQVPTQRNAFNLLHSSEKLPEIPPDLPNTVYELLAQHQQANLSSFELAKKKHWSSSLKLRFSKRTYLYNKIKERAQRNPGNTAQERMQNAALAMDREKGTKSMNEYLKLLKSIDPTTKSRSKRKASEIESNA